MAEANTTKRAIGIGQHSYSQPWKGTKGAPFHNALTFLEYAHSIGAAGVQVAIQPAEQPNASKIRERVEQLGAYFEGNIGLPPVEGSLDAFEAHIKAIHEAGGAVARTACLSGRRYETFKTLEEFRAFKTKSIKSLQRAEPIVRKHQVKLAIENHKDWMAAEHVELLRGLGSEWIGALVDVGNNISFLEDPYEVIETLAPIAFSSHFKDMAVQPYQDGFLLSEVPFPEGFLDLPRVVAMIHKANPKIRLNLEMMTRDPLKIPCLTAAYYKPFEEIKASRLAATLAMVKEHTAAKLPKTSGLTPEQILKFEDDNVRACVHWANANI